MRTLRLQRIMFAFVVLLALLSPLFARTAQAAGTGPERTLPYAPGTVIHAASCEQAPAQTVKDRATYTSAELARYGLPPRMPGEPFDKWANVVRSAGKRYCDRIVGSILHTTDQHSTYWDGNIADEPFLGGHSYTEVDSNFYVPCDDTDTIDSWASPWVGLGGWGNKNLVQTGIDVHRFYVSPWVTSYQAWVENLGDPNNPGTNYLQFQVNCGDWMYVTAWGGNCMYIEDITNSGVNSGNQCYGPNANDTSAEGILERLCISSCFAPLANICCVTFHGQGITDNGNYVGMDQTYHDYTNMWSSSSGGYEVANVGPIQYDSTDYPHDMYTMNWLRYS